MSMQQEYCAGSVSTNQDAKVNGARHRAIELGDDAHELCDTNNNSDSDNDSGNDAVFEEAFVQLGLDGELEDMVERLARIPSMRT